MTNAAQQWKKLVLTHNVLILETRYSSHIVYLNASKVLSLFYMNEFDCYCIKDFWSEQVSFNWTPFVYGPFYNYISKFFIFKVLIKWKILFKIPILFHILHESFLAFYCPKKWAIYEQYLINNNIRFVSFHSEPKIIQRKL